MGSKGLPSACALTEYNGQLVAGGHFGTAGGMACNCIASWDGSYWRPLGSGMSSKVDALTVHNGELVAGGYFTTADGVACNGIASCKNYSTTYHDTYARWSGHQTYRRMWGDDALGQLRDSAEGPMCGDPPRLHGRWTYSYFGHNPFSFREEHEFYWYGEKVSQGEWHLRNR